MKMHTIKEHSVQITWEALKCLTKPFDKIEEINHIEEAFKKSIELAVDKLGFKNFNDLPVKEKLSCASVFWEYVEVASYILLCVKEKLNHGDLTVLQQRDVRSCLQFIVSLGVLPNLISGVGLSLPLRSNVSESLVSEDISEVQKYKRLCIVIRTLLDLYQDNTLRGLIICNVFGDLLAGLCQLSFVPLKKPAEDQHTSSASEFVMTLEFWEKLQNDREIFKSALLCIIKNTYQPVVISELMVLQACHKERNPPVWLKKSCSKLLTSCLIQQGGVGALIRATLDSAPDTGADWKKIDTLALIITSPKNHYKNIAEQLWKLMTAASPGTSDVRFIVVACVKLLFEKEPSVCMEFFINHLLQPFMSCSNHHISTSIGEKTVILEDGTLSSSLHNLSVCFVSNLSSVTSSCLPAHLLIPIVPFLFKLFQKINNSASHISAITENLLYHTLSSGDSSALAGVLKCILLGEPAEGIYTIPDSVIFSFGPAGGVQVEIAAGGEQELLQSSVEEAGDSIFLLLQKEDANYSLSSVVFQVLLQLLVDQGLEQRNRKSNDITIGTVEDSLRSLMKRSEKHLGIIRLLAALAEISEVQNKLANNSDDILKFLLSLLEAESLSLSESCESTIEDEELECVFVAFMVLDIILQKCDSPANSEAFRKFLDPIAAIRVKTRNAELKRLASGIYNTITNPTALQAGIPSKEEISKSECDQALHDACDPLLPVRGHALVKLTKLLLQGDKETISKKDAVLCLLQECLKNEDSFIYLAAINGLVAIASIQPDSVVKSLTREFIAVSKAGDDSRRNPEVRMKIGEVLVKLVRVLGEKAPMYKNELLNAFLMGVKDDDHLMRASSLSNLGETCRILGFRVGPILEELLLCVRSIVKHDKAVEPRRAAVMVTTLLLQGLENDAISILHEAVLELYRTLKDIYYNDPDDVVKLHAQLALEEMGKIAQNFLFPALPMTKKIQVL